MTNITVGLFNRESKIFTVKVSVFRQKSKESRPFIGDKGTNTIIDTINKFLYSGITTSADLPSESAT